MPSSQSLCFLLLGCIGLLASAEPVVDISAAFAIPGAQEPAAPQPADYGLQPPSVQHLRRTNRVHQVAAGKKPWPPSLLLRDYRKHGAVVPSPVVKAAAATAKQTGSAQATDVAGDSYYMTPVKIGNQKFMLDFDTGSSDLWVFSKELPASEQGSHVLYNLEGEKFPKKGEKWDISYVDGTGASGNVYIDKVVVGGVTATVQGVECATSVSSSFTTGLRDGLLGLGFDSGNTGRPYQLYTFMHQVLPTLPKPLFTVSLRHLKPGTFDFGFIDKASYTGSIGYTAVDNSSAYWGLYPSAYQVGSGAKKSYSFFTIADTGTSFLYLPPSMVSDYWSQVQGAVFNTQYGFWFFPCTSKLPNFSLFINGHKATVPGSYINVGPTGLGDGNCFGSMLSDANNPNAVLGDTFLKSQFVVFNLDGPIIGFAQQKGIPSS